MNDKFILIEDMYQNHIVIRESEIKNLVQSKEFSAITFMDGHKLQVKTMVNEIWIQLSQNQK